MEEVFVKMTDEEYENYKKNKELVKCGVDLDKILKYIGFKLLDEKYYKNPIDPLDYHGAYIKNYKDGNCEVTVVTKK